MASPFHHFRRHQKTLLAVFGVIIMFVFVVGSALQGLTDPNRAAQAAANETVVTWKGGSLSEAELAQMNETHRLLVNFLAAVARETMSKNGMPIAPGFSTNQMGQIQSPGIPVAMNEQTLVETRLLADKARQTGMVVNDEAIYDFLENQLAVGLLTRGDLARILEQSTGGRLTDEHMFEALRTELLAQNMRLMGQSALFADRRPIVTPATAWDYYLRMNRQAKVELLPVEAEEMLDEVKQKPSEAALRELFEEHKEEFGHPALAEPGFRQRQKLAFSYLKATMKEFLDREIANLTEEQIQAEYDRRVALGQYRVTPEATEPATSESPNSEPAATEPPATESPANESTEPKPTDPNAPASETPKPEPPADEKPAPNAEPPAKPESTESPATEEKPADSPTSEPAKSEEKPSEEKPAEEKPAEEKPAEEKPAEEKPAEEKPAEEKPAEEKPAEEKPAEEKPAEETSTEEPSSEPAASDQSNRAADVTKFVALLDEESDSSEENAPATEPKTESDPNATEPPANETGDKPAEDKPAEDKPAEETAVEEKPMADEKPTAEKPAAAETPASETPAEETAGDAKPAETTPASDSPAEVASEPRIQPLSEVRDEIAEALATPLAREKRDEALQAAENDLATYYGKLAKWEALKDTEKAPKKPDPINAEALAKKHNLTAGSVPLSDPLEVDQYELGQTRTFSFANQQFQQFSFAELTYGPNVALFEPQRIRGNVDEDYLYWATEQVEEHVPDFKEAREQVERAWKLEMARELAQEKARELAQKAEKANQPLAEVFPDKAEQILSPEAFSWITSGSVPMMGGMPHLSSVEGVEYPSSEFMGDVFKLDPGQVGVAANQPKTTWYVVRLVEESPAIDQLRNGFMEANYADTGRDPSLFIAFQEKNQLFGGWYENLEEQMDVNWARPGRSLMGGG